MKGYLLHLTQQLLIWKAYVTMQLTMHPLFTQYCVRLQTYWCITDCKVDLATCKHEKPSHNCHTKLETTLASCDTAMKVTSRVSIKRLKPWCMKVQLPNLNVKVLLITGGEVPCELQDSCSVLFPTSYQEPILTGVNRWHPVTLSKAILHGETVKTINNTA